MGTWNYRTMITGLTSDLLRVNEASKAVAIDKDRSRLHMDKKIHFPPARQVSNLTRVHDFGGCCQKQPDFFPATEGTGLILSLQLRSSNGPVSLIIAYSPRLDSRLRPSIGSTMTSAIIESIPERGPRFYSETSMY